MATIWLLTILCALVFSAAVPEDIYHSHIPSPYSNDTIGGLNLRAAAVIGSSTCTVWPLRPYHGNTQLRTIHHCYATPEDRAEIWCQLQDGIRLWSNALGGAASAATGHSLAFAELHDESGQPISCYLPGTWNPLTKSGTLHPRVPDEMLMIAVARYNRPSDATVGYIPSGSFMRHHLDLVPSPGPGGARVAAHELGHVLGMVHEMQRDDRDAVVLFTCQNVSGFQDCVNRAIAAGTPEDVARKRLCEDLAFAVTYACPTAQYIKGQLVDNTLISPVPDSPPDVTSIMMYGSGDFASDECYQDKFKCPLLRWTFDEYGEQWGTEMIHYNYVPSAWDVNWVRRYYPWAGSTTADGSNGNASANTRRTTVELNSTSQTMLYEKRRSDGSWTYMYRVRR